MRGYKPVYSAHPCPVCGSKVVWDVTCPGYPVNLNGKPTVMVCSYGCGNAEEWNCTNEDCGWWFRYPNNRGDESDMGVCPPWDYTKTYDDDFLDDDSDNDAV